MNTLNKERILLRRKLQYEQTLRVARLKYRELQAAIETQEAIIELREMDLELFKERYES